MFSDVQTPLTLVLAVAPPFNCLSLGFYNPSPLSPTELRGFFPHLGTPPPGQVRSRPPQKSFLVHIWIMSSTQEKPWSDNPNAPKISLSVYHFEKASFAGAFICSILYGMHKKSLPTYQSVHVHSICSAILGIVIALFFKCIAALSNPSYRKGERIKWGLVFYTVAIFSVVTVQTAMNLDITSIAYIDNRNFPGIEGELPPGPYGYEMFMAAEALNVIPNVMFLLNDWLADGIMVSSLFDATFTCTSV